MAPTKGWNTKTLKEKILDNISIVSETGCWIWTGNLANGGYATINHNKQRLMVHREVRGIFLGDKIDKGHWACHTCDLRCCVNPHHIYHGSAQTNTIDALSRGRRKTALTFDQVKMVYSSKLSGKKLAGDLGCSETTISKIRRGHIWSWLTQPRAAEPLKTQMEKAT